jgi:hypothetical protein
LQQSEITQYQSIIDGSLSEAKSDKIDCRTYVDNQETKFNFSDHSKPQKDTVVGFNLAALGMRMIFSRIKF